MIIVLKQNPDRQQLDGLKSWLTEKKLDLHIIEGELSTIIGLVGDTAALDMELLESIDIVDSVKRIQEPYKKANRKFNPFDTVITLECGTKIGGGNFAMMAGPCSVESREQICEVARSVKASGANILRGGAFKPRTSPYAFQGMGGEGIDLLLEAKAETGLPIITEIMDLSQLHFFENVDIIQVGARNMQNFTLLRELGKVHKRVLLKRGLSNTIDELLMSVEYIMASGTTDVMLCERGIRTFETATRNTLDLSAIPVLKAKTHLPIIVDPSHATGYYQYVPSLTMGAVATGCDGLIIEVHNNPQKALCDGAQSLTPESFSKLSGKVDRLRELMQELKD